MRLERVEHGLRGRVAVFANGHQRVIGNNARANTILRFKNQIVDARNFLGQ